MPWFGDRAPRPVFLTLGHHHDFDRLASNKRTWFSRWAGATLGQETLLPEKATEDLYGLAIVRLNRVRYSCALPGLKVTRSRSLPSR